MLRSVDKRVAELRAYVEAHWQEYESADSATGQSDSIDGTSSSNHVSLQLPSSVSSSASASAGRRQSVSSSMSALECSGGYLSCHKHVLDAISQASHLCQRSAGGDGEKLWFTLLDRFVQLQRQLKVSQQEDAPSKKSAVFPSNMQPRAVAYMHQALIGYVRAVLHSMMGSQDNNIKEHTAHSTPYSRSAERTPSRAMRQLLSCLSDALLVFSRFCC